MALLRGGKGLPAGGWAAAQDEAAARIGRVVQALGDRSVAIGGDVSGSVIVTGDQNVVQQRTGIALIPVDSSMVSAVGYDEERHCLEVVFNTGRVYCYESVPPEVFQGLLEAESKGCYMLAHIIDVYPYRRGPCSRRR